MVTSLAMCDHHWLLTLESLLGSDRNTWRGVWLPCGLAAAVAKLLASVVSVDSSDLGLTHILFQA